MTELGTELGAGPAEDLDADLGERTEAVVARVAAALDERLPEITRGMRAELGAAIAELVGDHRLQDLLGRAIEGNVGTVLSMLRHRVPLPEVEIPAAAVTHARRLAQQGVPVFALVRAYRLGQGHLLDEGFAELGRHCADPHVALRAFKAMNARVLAYIDWVSQEVVTVYETERDQWVRNQDAVRTAHIADIVAGRVRADVPELEAVLSYRLGQHHVAAVLWAADDTAPDTHRQREAAVVALARELGARGAPVTVAADRATTWAWFPRGADGAEPDVEGVRTRLRARELDGVRVALGAVLPGLDGFGASHRQAVEAQHVLAVGGHPARAAVAYREPGVAVAAMLSRDLDRTRAMVRGVLGPLAADDGPADRLRETLLCFLECGSSYTAAAARHALHKNSVKYRVERALERRGRPLGDDRIDVELALVACRWLPAALREPSATA